jgi:hypothetical protein
MTTNSHGNNTSRVQLESFSSDVWSVTVSIHFASNLDLEGAGSWKTIFDIFGSKYTGEEYTRRDDNVYFNLKKAVFCHGPR